MKKLSILQDLSNKAFVDEIICLQKAHHSNIVRLLGYCAVAHGELMEVNGTHVIAEETQRLLCFEYVPNGDLQDYIKGIKLATQYPTFTDYENKYMP